MDPSATPFVPQAASRLTECYDTLKLVVKTPGVNPMLLRAVSRELCLCAQDRFLVELGLNGQTHINHKLVCQQLLDTIPVFDLAAFFVNGEELYADVWPSDGDEWFEPDDYD